MGAVCADPADKDSPGCRVRCTLKSHARPAVATQGGNHTLAPVNKVILILLAIFLPPLAVYLKTKSGKDTLISLILSLVFWFPGVLFALWKVLA